MGFYVFSQFRPVQAAIHFWQFYKCYIYILIFDKKHLKTIRNVLEALL